MASINQCHGPPACRALPLTRAASTFLLEAGLAATVFSEAYKDTPRYRDHRSPLRRYRASRYAARHDVDAESRSAGCREYSTADLRRTSARRSPLVAVPPARGVPPLPGGGGGRARPIS